MRGRRIESQCSKDNGRWTKSLDARRWRIKKTFVWGILDGTKSKEDRKSWGMIDVYTVKKVSGFTASLTKSSLAESNLIIPALGEFG